MTISYAGANNASSIGTTLSIPFGVFSPLYANNLLVVGIASKYAYPANTPAGWTLVASLAAGSGPDTGADSGTIYTHVLTKIANGTETDVSITLPAGAFASGVAMRITKNVWNDWATHVSTGSDTSQNTSWSVTGDSAPGLVTNDAVLAHSGINASLSRSAEAFTSPNATFGVGTAVDVLGTAPDGRHVFARLHLVPVTGHTGGGSTSPVTNTATLSAGGAGTEVFLRLREVPNLNYVQPGANGTGVNGTSSVSPSYPSGVAAGDLVLLCVVSKYAYPDSTPAGWGILAQHSGGAGASGPGSGTVYLTIFYRIATGSLSGSVTINVTGGNVMRAHMTRFAKASAKMWSLATAVGGDSSQNTTYTAASTTPLDWRVGDMAFVFTGLNAASALSGATPTLTAPGITFGFRGGDGAVLSTDSGTTTTGDDLGSHGRYAAVNTGTATATTTYNGTTGSTATAGATIFVRLRQVDALVEVSTTPDVVEWESVAPTAITRLAVSPAVIEWEEVAPTVAVDAAIEPDALSFVEVPPVLFFDRPVEPLEHLFATALPTLQFGLGVEPDEILFANAPLRAAFATAMSTEAFELSGIAPSVSFGGSVAPTSIEFVQEPPSLYASSSVAPSTLAFASAPLIAVVRAAATPEAIAFETTQPSLSMRAALAPNELRFASAPLVPFVVLPEQEGDFTVRLLMRPWRLSWLEPEELTVVVPQPRQHVVVIDDETAVIVKPNTARVREVE